MKAVMSLPISHIIQVTFLAFKDEIVNTSRSCNVFSYMYKGSSEALFSLFTSVCMWFVCVC